MRLKLPGRFSIAVRANVAWLIGALYLPAVSAQVVEPYQKLNGGSFQQPTHQNSPDPLVDYRWSQTHANDSLQIYELFPGQQQATPSAAFTIEGTTITVRGKGDVFFDFGVVSAGWIEFESDNLSGDVAVSISEYTEPAVFNEGSQHPVKTLKPARYGNTYRLELNNLLYEGVRFAWLHVNSFEKTWQLKNFRLVCQIKPTNYLGRFYCNDTMLNRIWYTGAYTVKLNLLQDYFGAILMERSDRHSWTGDAYPSQAASLAAFGNFDFVRKNILFTSLQDNGIASYPIYWVLGLVDYYQYTGDSIFFRSQIGNAQRKLQQAFEHFNDLPRLRFMGWDERLGAGFEHPDIEESQQAYRWLCINAWKKFASAVRSTGDHEMALQFEAYAQKKQRQLEEDTITLKKLGLHALAEAVNAGVNRSPNVLDILNDRFRDRNQRLSYSPFNQYFIIQAMALSGKLAEAITTVKDQWGGQINYGGTTFFEVFRPSWNDVLKPNSAPVNNQCGYTSLAHPWGAGVVRWISEEILGIKSLEPGFKKFRVAPWATEDLTQISGDVPTPYGKISLSMNTLKGSFEIIVPSGTEASEVYIPKAGKIIKRIMLNNRNLQFVDENEYFISLKNLKSGKHTIRIEYGESLPEVKDKPSPLCYAIQSFETQTLGAGDYIPAGDGWLKPGLSKAKHDLKKPDYIDSVVIKRAGYEVWDIQPDVSSAPRALQRAFITRDPIPTLQTFPIDVYSKKGVDYQISLYFIDPDQKGRRCAFEVFDAETFEILAPVQIVDHLETGKLIRFKVERPVRIRINHVRGPNAALGGVFFEKAL